MNKKLLIGAIAAVAILVCFIFMSVIGNNERKVTYVIPDGKIGVFKIVLDPKSGSPLSKTPNGYICEFPDSGILKVPSFRQFEKWHVVEGRYKSGKTIPYMLERSGEEGGVQTAIWPLSTTSDGITFILVGTREDFDKIIDSDNRLQAFEAYAVWNRD